MAHPPTNHRHNSPRLRNQAGLLFAPLDPAARAGRNKNRPKRGLFSFSPAGGRATAYGLRGLRPCKKHAARTGLCDASSRIFPFAWSIVKND